MNRTLILAFVFVTGVAGPSYSQPTPGDRIVGLAEYLQEGYATLKLNLTEAAEQMDEANYEFRPGSMHDARTYGQVFAHVASAQFSTCAPVTGRPNPSEGKKLEEELSSKAEFQAALADSFVLCDDAFADLTEARASELVKYGQVQITRGHCSRISLSTAARCTGSAPSICAPRTSSRRLHSESGAPGLGSNLIMGAVFIEGTRRFLRVNV